MLDLIITNGTIVDGTGGEPVEADIGVSGGVIAGIGRDLGPAADRIDAAGRVVAPGFVDMHTHYDAQLMWDGLASPSVLHGVTTVIGGNCGFGLAPVRDGDGAFLATMLSRVEGMPLQALEEGLSWEWASFADWLARMDGRLAVNAGFLVGHSTLRRAAMGERAGEPMDDEALAALLSLTDAALADGALGFSTSLSPTHNDASGAPVPSRRAEERELLEMARRLARFEGSVLEMIPPVISRLDPGDVSLMRRMSAAAERPLNWNLLKVSSTNRDDWETSLGLCGLDPDTGGEVIALTLPELNVLSVSLGQGFLFDAIDGWGEVLALPVAARMVALRDPATRDRMRAGARQTAGKPTGRVGIIAALADVTVGESHSPDNAAFVGRTIGDIARASGSDLLDTMLDIALGDDLRTRFAIPDLGDDDESWAMRAEVWQRDEVVIGGSDAGAHLDVMCSATYTTNLLGQAVRERGLLPLAQAVRLVTDVPARLYGLRRRGRLARGFAGDIVVFDPATVAARPPVTRHDLPGGSPRLFAESIGVGDVVVNGAAVVREGAVTGTLPGRVLRRGVDTETRHPGRWRA